MASGYETRQYSRDISNVYFSSNAEESVKNLYALNINYMIVSNRILKGFTTNQSVIKIDSNRQVNKIFSSDDNFGFYKFVPPPMTHNDLNTDSITLKFIEDSPQIQNVGSVYLVENDYYKMKISSQSPKIVYLGSPTQNMLGEGDFNDIFSFQWPGRENTTYTPYLVSEIPFSNISYRDNIIEYKTTITDKENRERWGTLIVRYIFFEKAVKREIIVANDWMNEEEGNSLLKVSVSSSVYAPAQNFQYQSIEEGQVEEKTRIFYPAQDAINFKDKKITEIYFDEKDTGFLMRYTDSAPYPSRFSYQGSTIYTYGGAIIGSDYSLNTAEPVDITQYFAVGDKKTTTNYIDKYQSVEISPYKDGIVPVILMGISSTPQVTKVTNIFENNTMDRNQTAINTTPSQDSLGTTEAIDATSVYNSFKLNDITYNKAVSLSSQLNKQNAENPIGYVKHRNVNLTLPEINTQNVAIKELKQDTGANGVLFEYFIYNINSIKDLQENKMIFGITYTVPAPFYDFFKEGLREPKFAYLEGEKTEVVLLPITQPTSSMLGSGNEPNNIFTQWKDTIDTVIDVGGVAVFIWDIEDMAMPSNQKQFLDLITYAKNKNVTFTTPDEIAQHYLHLQRITTNVTTGLDNVRLVVRNSNSEPVKGISYRISLPPVKGTCRYTVTNAIIQEMGIKNGMCIMTVNLDLDQDEVKEVQLDPEDERTRFDVDLSDIYEGTNKLIIREAETGIPVANSTLSMDNRKIYESNDKGEIEFPVRRGSHLIRIEKPGYITIESRTEVKGLFHKITGL